MSSASYPFVAVRVCGIALHVVVYAFHQDQSSKRGPEYRPSRQLDPGRFMDTFQKHKTD